MPTVTKPSNAKKTFAAIVAIITWVTILVQFYLAAVSITNFFSYFTILCNLLIVICLSYTLLAPASGPGVFFSSVSVQTAIALYIFIVGVIFNLVLRGLADLSGMAWVVDNLLHVVCPILYLLYWVIFVPRGVLKWKDVTKWVYFPLAYVIYSLIRGPIVNWFPYPFLNTTKLGYEKVLLNITVIMIVFLGAGLIMIAINRSLKKKR